MGNTSITDGGLGDDDLATNGAIVDQGGHGVPAAGAAIPALDMRGLILPALMVLGAGAIMRRHA